MGLIKEGCFHWPIALQWQKMNHSPQVLGKCSQYYIVLRIYLISISVGCGCWAFMPSQNSSVKVSLRSPMLFFLIKLIRQSAMGAGLTAARDRWCTYSNPRAVILWNCSEMWATWVITTTQGFRGVACSSAIIKQAALPVQYIFSLFFFFISCCSWAPSSWAAAPDLISGAINVELCPLVFTISLHMFLWQKPPARITLMLITARVLASHVLLYLLVNVRAGLGLCLPSIGCFERFFEMLSICNKDSDSHRPQFFSMPL